MLDISEIFYSIQGESTFAGLPCIFIRLAGCNLNCRYCDTRYSLETQSRLAAADILSQIKKYFPVKLVEITGGEPLLQTEVYALINLLYEEGYKILLETNGSINLANIPLFVHKIVDVKCPGSGCEDSFNKKNLALINKSSDEIKFVISSKLDYQWAKVFIKNNKLSTYQILFSAVTEKVSLKKLAEWILKDKIKARLQPQIHKFIWPGEERR